MAGRRVKWNHMKMGTRVTCLRLAIAVASIAAPGRLSAQAAPPDRVGPLADGSFLLNSGWRLRPAGKQIPLGTLPMASALSPDGKYLAVLNGGYNPPSITILETASARVVSSAPAADAWLGLAFSPKGDRLYVGGGSRAAVFEFAFANGTITPARTFPIVPEAQRTAQDFIGDVTLSPDGRLLYAANLFRDSVAVINPQSGMVLARYKTGRRPYRILFHPDGKSFFVSHWADGSVGHYDAATGSQLALVRLGAHPTDMVWSEGAPTAAATDGPEWAGRLFVAASNTNNVYSVGVTKGKDLQRLEVIDIAMTAAQPMGMTPSGLALDARNKELYVACSDANAAAVIDISEERSSVAGFIPAGWYPTAVRALPDGGLVILNGKGGGSHASRESAAGGPFVARSQTGSASWIAPFTADQLDSWTETARAVSPYADADLVQHASLPAIQHVIYIVKGSQSYDRVLGDVKEGNGDAALAAFGENVTPNQHKLARQFALLDNFYTSGDVDADGQNWSAAAIAPDFVQKLWPNSYGGRRRTYDYEGGDPAALPPAGYLWTNAAAAGITLRNYGFLTVNKPGAAAGTEQIATVRDTVLAKDTNRFYRGFDIDYPDVERAKTFVSEIQDFEKKGAMPRLLLVRLGNDRASTPAPGKPAARAMVAENDYALGMIMEAVSKSRFWPDTAIIVVENDAQEGVDHVDAHRAPAFVISPFARRGAVDHSPYNSASALRTVELLLGLRPMTQFDAAARPMAALFQAAPDPAPYAAEKPRVALDERNPSGQ